jgi:dihydroorotate dehydrogenase
MNAAGTLGFSPEKRSRIDINQFGAFITNPISLGSRTPARIPRFYEFPGGYLLHTGHPNPGMSAVIRQNAAKWKLAPLPIIVHLIGENIEDIQHLVNLAEGLPGVGGVEINLPPKLDLCLIRRLCQELVGEMPVILRLPLDQASYLSQVLSRELAASVMAISLGPPRGSWSVPGSGILSGRLYGPALYPLSLAVVQEIADVGLPVIGAGGVYSLEQVEEMLSVGAIAVQLDSVLWRGDFSK